MNFKEFAKIRTYFQKIGRGIFKRLALFFLILLVIDLIIGAVLLWSYILSPTIKGRTAVPTPLMLNKAFLDRFSQDWALREENFNKVESQKYPDIFNNRTSQTTLAPVSATSSATSSKTH